MLKKTRPAEYTAYLIQSRAEALRRLAVASARIDEHTRKAIWFAHAIDAYGRAGAFAEALWHRHQLAHSWRRLALASMRLATIERSLGVQ